MPTFISKTICLLLLFTTSCNSNSGKRNDNTDSPVLPVSTKQLVFDKLVGTWQSEDGKSFERWRKNDDGTYRSNVFSVKGTDTSWNEQANIYPDGDKWIFENMVKWQNDGKSVKFTSTQLSENSVQFSNPAHDFPTDVNYTVAGENTVNAFIVGPNKSGGKDTIPYNYKRVQ